MPADSRRTGIIAVLIIVVLLAFGIVVGIILYPYFTEDGITAKEARKWCDEHISGMDKTLVFYGVRTEGEMIKDGKFDEWWVDYHHPPDENGIISVERYKVTREREISLLTTLRHVYEAQSPTDWVYDSTKAFSVARSDPDIKDYLKDNEDDVDVEVFALEFRNATQRYEWTLRLKNEGWKEIHSAEISFVDGTGEILGSEVVYY